ncbi:cysteine-rich CWC family protein [Algivirga pacifica]|uniref:Cysteine-rich CWC n=1 Tax=Algivirga pacifica TaxID=1162670 RepID=A0ABP9DAR8_9BACT
MTKHEMKTCVRCQKEFECKVGSVTECQCYAVSLTNEERQYIYEHFEDCLCADCMLELKAEFIAAQKEKSNEEWSH